MSRRGLDESVCGGDGGDEDNENEEKEQEDKGEETIRDNKKGKICRKKKKTNITRI